MRMVASGGDEALMRFDIITLFPDIFSGYLAESLLSKAIAAGLVEVHLHDLRHGRPINTTKSMTARMAAARHADPGRACGHLRRRRASVGQSGRTVDDEPNGQRLNQAMVTDLASQSRLILLCGRYEGFDHRVIEILKPREVSLGDFILNGGEVAAMAIIDATIRLIPNVLGDERSSQEDSHSVDGWLEFPQYTRPREYRGLEVPEVLLNGNHREIAAWREQQSRLRSNKDT